MIFPTFLEVQARQHMERRTAEAAIQRQLRLDRSAAARGRAGRARAVLAAIAVALARG